MLNRKSSLFATLALFSCSFTLQAAWVLDDAASSLYYVTSKASAVSEVNTFATLNGAISDQGEASLSITLSSVDTGVAIRNERMQEFVFEVAQYPAASVTVAVDSSALANMPAGTTKIGTYPASINLHGNSQTLDVNLQISKLNASTIQVTTSKPLLLGAGLFGLTEGVEKLRELAGLPAINPNVVVNFTLVYNKQ